MLPLGPVATLVPPTVLTCPPFEVSALVACARRPTNAMILVDWSETDTLCTVKGQQIKDPNQKQQNDLLCRTT